MVSVAHSEAIVEVLEILSQLKESQLNKIPKSFIEFLKKNASPTYEFKLDKTEPLKNYTLKRETKAFLALIYISYWCESEEEKNRYIETLDKNEREYQKELSEKYSVDNLFKENKKQLKEIEEEKNNKLDVPKQNILSKIISIIRKIFLRKES